MMGPAQTVEKWDGDEFDRLRRKWAGMLNGSDAVYDDNDSDMSGAIAALTRVASDLWDRMDSSPGAACLWSDLASDRISAQLTENYRRIKCMAVAFTTVGSPLYGNPALRDAILQALDWMYEHRYNESADKYDNWWDWDIGVPLQLNDAMALMYEWLGPARMTKYAGAIERCTAEVTMTGANRVWVAIIVGVRGVIVKDSAKISAARDGLSEVFPYVTERDGFYADGSFVQHQHYAYTGGYGISLLGRLSELLLLLHDSSWAVTDARLKHVFTWVYDAYRPLLYKGAMMDMSRGREISRPGMEDHDAGHAVIQAVLRLSHVAPPAIAADFRAMVKAWIREDSFRHFYGDASVSLIAAAKAIDRDETVLPAKPLAGYWQFAAMDRAVHRRPGFALAIAMYSARISSYESINRENLRGWYTGFGTTYLYNEDLGQFSGGFWPTVDAHRMPGTTVLAGTPVSDHKSLAHGVGGTDMDGLYGACGMELRASSFSLTAYKSWFMFDDEIVALGAGISSRDGIAIETIVDNRKLGDRGRRQPLSAEGGGRQLLTVDGNAREADADWLLTHAHARWAHLSGHVPGSDIGYYFPQPVRLKTKCEMRSGSWKEINDRPEMPTAPIHNRYMTMWLEHGVNPQDEHYQYVLLPNKTSAEVAEYACDPGVTVLENSAEAQAVKSERLQIVAINFWQKAWKTVGQVTCDSQASVMVREKGGELWISVSDPGMNKAGSIQIEWARPAERIIEADANVTVLQLHPVIRLSVHAEGARGSASKAKFTAKQ